jgi:hypothetical protein
MSVHYPNGLSFADWNLSWKYFIKIHLLRMVLLDTQRKGKTEANTHKQTDTHICTLWNSPYFQDYSLLLCALQYSWASTYQFMTLIMLLYCIHSIYNFKKTFKKLLLKMAVYLWDTYHDLIQQQLPGKR